MDIAEQISKEISGKLRGYEGMRPEKLIDCPSLLGAVGTSDPVRAYERVVGALDRMPQDKYTEALRNALGLAPNAADSLTGSGGRRGQFALSRDVSEETVKLWESRGITTLTRYLLSGLTEPKERLWVVSAIFYMFAGRVTGKRVRHIWKRANFLRFEYQLFTSEGEQPTNFIYHQLEPGHDVESLDLTLVFPENQPPQGVMAVDGMTTWDHMARNPQAVRLIDGPHRALSVLAEEDPPSAEEVEALGDAECYHVEWLHPEPMKLYGLTIT